MRLVRLALTAALALSAVSLGTAAEAVPKGAMTTVVLKVAGCDGCRFSPSSSLDDGTLWQTKAQKVRDGKVTFTMPTVRTRGLRLALDAPFEGNTGGVPHVVFHYEGMRFGEDVSAYAATTARKGSVCFAGSAKKTLRLAITVRQEMIVGNDPDGALVVGALAYASTTQRTLRPFELVRDGYFAAQAVPTCHA